MLNVKYGKNGLSIRGFPVQKISPAFKTVLQKMLKHKSLGHADWNDLSELSHLTDPLAPRELKNLFSMQQHKTLVTQENDQLEKQLELMIAEKEAGNNSPVMAQQISELVADLRRKNRISKERGKEILESL